MPSSRGRATRRSALEALRGAFDASWHEDFASAFVAIPFESEATVSFGIPAGAEDVQLFKG